MQKVRSLFACRQMIGRSFFDWLARKYGWGETTFCTFEEDFKTTLLNEYNEIRKSYGQAIIFAWEIVDSEEI